MMRSMTGMMTSLDSRLGTIEGDSRKKRKVVCRGETSTTRSASQRLQPLLVATYLPTLPLLLSTSPADVHRPATPLDPALQREGTTATTIHSWLIRACNCYVMSWNKSLWKWKPIYFKSWKSNHAWKMEIYIFRKKEYQCISNKGNSIFWDAGFSVFHWFLEKYMEKITIEKNTIFYYGMCLRVLL